MHAAAADALRDEVAAIRDGVLLGRSEKLRDLFDYLAACSLEERSPKEAEVASSVFGRPAGFNPDRDAVVRVYIHKLRKRLDAIYAGPRAGSASRLAIPLGQYRLVLSSEVPAIAAPPQAAPRNPPLRPRRHVALLLLAALGLIAGSSAVTLLVQRAALPPALKDVQALRSGPVWSPILRNRFPTLIAIGDYYIFGDSQDGMQADRLIREYAINSEEDLDNFLVDHPDKMGRYIDLGLRYLPVGDAFALRSVLPLVESWRGQKSTRIVLASALTPDMLKTNNVVYLGYFSGLGELRDRVFAGSRFSIGDTYDEIHDDRTHRQYVSQGGGPAGSGVIYRDFGYFSTFDGPGGNRIIAIVGTRDVGLMQTAELVTHARSLQQAVHAAGRSDSFEALYRVDGMNRLNMGGALLTASPLRSEAIWKGDPLANRFPAG